MKKITLLLFFISGLLCAQQQSYTEIISQNQTNESSNQIAIITRIDNNRQAIIDTYTTIEDFNTAVTENCSEEVLISEDFGGGPTDITPCGPIISDSGDTCFPAGELESGFNVQASNATDMINIPPGAIGNVDSLIGASTFAEFTIINFLPDVFAVAMDLWENNDPITIIRVFGTRGTLIETFNVDTPINTQTFFGIIADEPISVIELEGANGSGELFGNFLFGANCTALSINDNLLLQLTLSPNPSSDLIKINLPVGSGIEIKSIVLFDILGKIVLNQLDNNQVNISNLPKGVYMLHIKTSEGSINKKVIKK
jgi:hypothetical protein